MSDVTLDQNQGATNAPVTTPFGPTPKSAPSSSYYSPATLTPQAPDGPVPPSVPMSSGAYNPGQHAGADNVTFYVRGTNSGGMPKGYFSQGAMHDFDSVLDPAETKPGSAKPGNQLHSEFDWYGGLDNELARRVAGRRLLNDQVLPAWEDGKSVNLVAHSHGGNVVNEFGGELNERMRYTQALSAGLSAPPGSPQFKAAQAAISDREGMIQRDLAEFKTRYGTRPTGGEAELLGDLKKEISEINKAKLGLSGADPGVTASLKRQTAVESAAMQKGKIDNVMYLDTPFRQEHDPLTQNPQFQNRVGNFYNVYNPDDFVVRNLAGKNILGGNQLYPGFDSFGRGFEVGNEATYTLPEGGNIHNIAWHQQDRNLKSLINGSHSDLIGDRDPNNAGDTQGYYDKIRQGITGQIQSRQFDGPNVQSSDVGSMALRGVVNNLQKNAYKLDDPNALNPLTGEFGAQRQGGGARVDLTPWRSSGALFGGLNGTANTRLGTFSGGVGDVRVNDIQAGAEFSRDDQGNDIMSGTLRRTTGVDNLHGGVQTKYGGADFSAGSISQGWEGRVSKITNPNGTSGYAGDASWGGVRATDLNTTTNIGGLSTKSHVGSIDTNTRAGGSYITQPDGSVAATGGATWGGVRVNDINTTTQNDKFIAGARLGSFSTANSAHGKAGYDATADRYYAEGGGDVGDMSFKDFQAGIASKDGKAYANGGFGGLRVGGVEGGGHLDYDPKTGQVHAQGGGRGGGFNLDNAQLNYGVQGLGSVNASVGNVTTDTIVKDAQFNGGLRQGQASVGHLEGMGFAVRDGKITSKNELLGVNQDASFGYLGNMNTLDGAKLNYDFKNLRDPRLSADFDKLSYGGLSGEKLHYGLQGPGGTNVNANLGSFGLSALNIANGHLDLSKNGLDASVGKTSYDAVNLSNLDVNGGVGKLAQFNAHLGEGSYNHFGADSASVQLDKNGLSASMRNGNYRYLAGKDITLGQSYFNGAVGSNVHADEASVGGVDINKLRYNTTLKTTNLDAEGVGAHGAKITNLNANQHLGAAGTNVQAKELNALDLNVGKVHAASDNYGTKGNASVDNAKLDVLKVQDGHAGLTMNGKELAGVSGSYQSGVGLQHADANYDILHGKASGQVKDLSAGTQINNASVNIAGHKIAIPDMGGKVNVNAGGNADLFKGQAQGNLSLAGSSVNFGGHKVTVPEFAQASGGVDVSHGAANANIGGKNGLGADVNLSQGKVDVNLLGHHVDVVQTGKDTLNAVGSGAKKAWNTLTSW